MSLSRDKLACGAQDLGSGAGRVCGTCRSALPTATTSPARYFCKSSLPATICVSHMLVLKDIIQRGAYLL